MSMTERHQPDLEGFMAVGDGGHAPGHLRGFFLALLDLDEEQIASCWPSRLPRDTDPLAWVAGQLHNCTDILPDDSLDYFFLH
jgi:hypothetical protein